MARRRKHRDNGFSHINNVIVLWIIVILVNLGIMWLGQFAVTSLSSMSTIVLGGMVICIYYIDACLATVNVQKRRLEIKSDFLKPSKLKIGLLSIMVLVTIPMFI